MEFLSFSYDFALPVSTLVGFVTAFILLGFRLMGRTISYGSIVLLSLATFLLILAWFEPEYIEKTESSRAVALLDISDSLDEEIAAELIDRLKKLADTGIQIEVFPFAGSVAPASIELEDIRSYPSLRSAWSRLDIGKSDIEQALRGVTSSSGESVLLISDGRETSGAAESLFTTQKQFSSRIFPLVPEVQGKSSEQFEISQLYAPLLAPAKSSVDIRVSVRNGTNTPQSGTLIVRHGEEDILKKEIRITPGKEELIIAQSSPAQKGIQEVSAVLIPNSNPSQKSVRTTYLSAKQRERVLLISGQTEDARFLSKVLTTQEFQLENKVIGQDIIAPLAFSDYSLVVFNNTSYTQVGAAKLLELDTYVRDGGRFLMIGGNKSFGLGKWGKTKMSEILPVHVLPPQTEKKRLNVAVELVLDKSRSMNAGGKIEYAKEAAKEVIRNLRNEDYVGVIGFDTTPFIAIPIMPIRGNRDFAIQRVGTLYPTGKTNLFPAMDEGRRGLKSVRAGRKHMIVLTDGRIPDAGPYYIELVRRLRSEGVTVSTVMMGSEADTDLLRDMAEVGGGSFYQTTNARNLPRIFLSDIKVSTGERTMRENSEFLVRRKKNRKSLTTIASFPPLRGYVQTKRKEKATLELVTMALGKADPLLAWWSYGKGQSAAFTSDVNGRWSNFWISWPKFARFWTELIEELRPEKEDDESDVPFELRYYVQRGSLILDVALFDEEDLGTLTAKVKMPNGTNRTVPFESVAKGRFQRVVSDATAGKYEVTLQAGQKLLSPVAFVLPGDLFGETKGQGFDIPHLAHLAGQTRGILNPSPKDLKQQVYQMEKKEPYQEPFLLLALLCICLDIFLREVYTPRT